ncbi:acetyltransferase (GNAT) family protein [mine drainage metagenome]|uniref:Acetyltransferase (GNAT) family protein n=1 Tax=mine drainage metagenome TaxID=410659 RepID=A0A1J5SB24_9ZZZZ
MNSFYENSKDGYLISTDPSKLNIEVIHKYLSQESYWAKDIPFETVKKSIEHSLCFGLYYLQEQIGFARLITDKATFAYLADVFILKEYRGKGLSKFLMSTIQSHPELLNLRRWLLATKDAHGLYEQFGWTRFTEELSDKFMTRHNPDVYKKAE